jgi:hypothetical protein
MASVVPLRYLLPTWLVLAAIRVALGASTSPVAYVLFGLLLLVSIALLICAMRLIVVAEGKEQRIEGMSICIAMVAILGQGLFGNDDTIPIATLAFFASLIVLLCVYARRMRRRDAIHL